MDTSKTRAQNTTLDGQPWSEETKELVWEKGRIIPDFDPDIWRWDKCGKTMKWNDHGDRTSRHGWEIDHINPVSNGGDDDFMNLQPLNWETNVYKGDRLDWKCGE